MSGEYNARGESHIQARPVVVFPRSNEWFRCRKTEMSAHTHTIPWETIALRKDKDITLRIYYTEL